MPRHSGAAAVSAPVGRGEAAALTQILGADALEAVGVGLTHYRQLLVHLIPSYGSLDGFTTHQGFRVRSSGPFGVHYPHPFVRLSELAPLIGVSAW